MKFRKIREQEASIGVAPFMDMVFLLLIFFMVTSHFDVASGVPIQLPKIAGKTFDEKREKVTVVIDKSGHVYLRGNRLDMKALGDTLKGIVKEKGLISLVLQADKDVPHGIVVEAMDVAKTSGVQTIIIAAQWRPKRLL
jgi:biopolymer transport protein ExbD